MLSSFTTVCASIRLETSQKTLTAPANRCDTKSTNTQRPLTLLSGSKTALRIFKVDTQRLCIREAIFSCSVHVRASHRSETRACAALKALNVRKRATSEPRDIRNGYALSHVSVFDLLLPQRAYASSKGCVTGSLELMLIHHV
jgi:hypothetical protein